MTQSNKFEDLNGRFASLGIGMTQRYKFIDRWWTLLFFFHHVCKIPNLLLSLYIFTDSITKIHYCWCAYFMFHLVLPNCSRNTCFHIFPSLNSTVTFILLKKVLMFPLVLICQQCFFFCGDYLSTMLQWSSGNHCPHITNEHTQYKTAICCSYNYTSCSMREKKN